MMKEEAFIEKKTNLEITIEALREVEQLKNTPNKKSYSSFAELLKDIEDEEDIYTPCWTAHRVIVVCYPSDEDLANS